MSAYSRRDMFRFGAAGVGMSLLPWRAGAQGGDASPHFFLQVLIANGWDTSYLFDARPLANTAAGEIQNYLGTEPNPWVGANGATCLGSRLVEPLRPYFHRFSILNGVHMAASFDGHEQNKNFLLTGNPFGGELQIPHLNRGAAPASLDFVQVGTTFGLQLSNQGGGVVLDPETAAALTGGIAAAPAAAVDPTHAYAEQRLRAAGAEGNGRGLFADGATRMLRGLVSSSELSRKLRDVEVSLEGSALQQALKLAHQYFRRGIAHGALIILDSHPIDAHDTAAAQAAPRTYADVVRDLGEIFAYLEESGLAETTTFVIGSEFGRTMRQSEPAIDVTGTDHNPQSNTILVGGKAFKGGMVVGASDRETVGEVVTQAHTARDAGGVKAMGRPFDFDATQALRGYDVAAYDEYRATDYLGYASIANSVYAAFGVPEDKWWVVDRNGPKARVLTGLMRG